MLEVKSLAFSYGNGPVFEDVSFSLRTVQKLASMGMSVLMRASK
jgi:iron complex transport system ATP-binding protein